MKQIIEYKIGQIYAIIKNTEVILVHGNLLINVYQDDLYIVIPINHSGSCQRFHHQSLHF